MGWVSESRLKWSAHPGLSVSRLLGLFYIKPPRAPYSPLCRGETPEPFWEPGRGAESAYPPPAGLRCRRLLLTH